MSMKGEMFYIVKVTMFYEDEKTGKEKKVREQYLVKDVSCQAAEARITSHFKKQGILLPFEVNSVSETKILDCITE